MRQFLLDRMDDGYCFPMNPVWPCRDKGWWEVWEKSLKVTPPANVAAWYSKKLQVRDIIERIHAACPNGFIQSADVAEATKKKEEQKPSEKAAERKAAAAAAAASHGGSQGQGGQATHPQETK